jgi:microcompartment protein CcmL/EutN
MAVILSENKEFKDFTDKLDKIIADLSVATKKEDKDIEALAKLRDNFKLKTEEFYNENRKLNIGVIGQVKAGKSSFLNTLLFDGKEILPKASTPKTATLTKMEYSEKNRIVIEYYSADEWGVFEDNALVDDDDEKYTSAREIMEMVSHSQINPKDYLEKGYDEIEFETYDDLIEHLNDYVGEDGKYTAVVKDVVLYLCKEEFKGISIVDTPGLNDPITSRTDRTREFMEVCDVVFFLSQSGSFLDKSDWELLSTQLPQKGVKKLVLIGSKFDSCVRDVLRVRDEDDDIFGDDDNTADNIPKACKIAKKKLKKRAKDKVAEFVEELERRESSTELIDVVKQCEKPIMISSIAENMTRKSPDEYSAEENNIYLALSKFSEDMESDLKLLGGLDEVNVLFDEAVAQKEAIMESKAKSFIPNVKEELKSLLTGFIEKADKKAGLLENNDMEQLASQKSLIEGQMNNIKADIATVFGELKSNIETEKAKGIREIREDGKDDISLMERTGTETKTGSNTTGFWFWKKTIYYKYESHYTYYLAADAVENIRKYAIGASNKAEEVFTEALQLKSIKRRLLDVIVNNFDMGSEKYDASLFKIAVEETVNSITFPVINIDISDKVKGISSEFVGEIRSGVEKNKLMEAESNVITKINNDLANKLEYTAANYKNEMDNISRKIEDSLLAKISDEYDGLIRDCENKDKEIAGHKEYAKLLQKELSVIK